MVGLGSDHYKEWPPLLAYRAGCPPKPSREPTEPPKAPETAPHAVPGRRGRKPQLHLPIMQQLEVVELYKAGVSVKEIAQRFHIHRATVSEICKRRCVPLRNESRGLTREQVQGAALRYVRGASLANVAKEFDSTPTTIRTAPMAAGIEMRPARGGKGKRAHIS
ncbi:Homeodomain-like domain-containing protein [Micrococcus terreus]|uniref:Homeodomain-like domain-containing protein n=1 Tax=Micrococcus terreus TaxID=574650 RepID=A0A1I7MQK6_9MICC|nr:Homeodomain-like domain-containing protein [Micrococcus terreus]